MKSHHLLVLATAIAFSACKKDKPEPVSSIIVGTSEEENFYSFESTVTVAGEYNKGVDEFELDVNRDGKMDIGFYAQVSGSPGGGVSSSVWVESLNDDFTIASGLIEYPIYKGEINDTNASGALVEIFQTDYLTNVPTDQVPLYGEEKKTEASLFEQFDVLKANDDFVLVRMNLLSESSWTSPNDQTSAGDTIYYAKQRSLYHEGRWSRNQEGFIGFKHKDKLGWIRVTIGEFPSVEILGWAISE